jgi:hypothetical protein
MLIKLNLFLQRYILFNNDQGATTFVTAIYNKFYFNMSSFSWIGLSSIASDDADKGSSPGDTGADIWMTYNQVYRLGKHLRLIMKD